MIRTLWLRLASVVLVVVALSLQAEEKREKDVRKKGDEAVAKEAKGNAEGKGAEEAKVKANKAAARAVDVENFRKSKDPAAMEIVALHDEVDKYYTELATARNVAAGEDKEARKAEREIKTYESKIKRQLKKLESEVDKYTRPLKKDYEEAKRKYDSLQEKGDQLTEQKQDKKATGYYQQADRYTGKMEGSKRQIDTAESFLQFDSAVPIEGLDDGDDEGDEDDGERRDRRDRGGDRGDRPDRGGLKAEKADKF